MVKKSKLYFGVFLFIFVIFACFSNNSVKAAENLKQQDILLKDSKQTSTVVSYLEGISPDIEVFAMEKIGLLRVNYPVDIDLKEAIEKSDISKEISMCGNLLSMEQKPVTLRDSDINNIQKHIPKFYAQNERLSDDPLSAEDLFYLNAWHVNEITNNGASLEKANGENVKVAVIDSGIDIGHPILREKINLQNATSYIPEDNSVQDTNGHGTMVSGVIAQVSPGAEITPYRVISESSGESLWTIQAIIQAVDDGNDIINISLGTYKSIDNEDELLTIEAFELAVNYAKENDVIVVASAGNKGLNLDDYLSEDHIKHLPGSIDGVITVSSNNESELASYSNYGTDVQLCAPGGDLVYIDGMLDLSKWIYCTYPTSMDNGLGVLGVPQGYSFSYGTSVAAPQVTAALADVIDYYNLTDQNRYSAVNYLEQSVDDLGDIGYDINFGYGKVNIDKAMN